MTVNCAFSPLTYSISFSKWAIFLKYLIFWPAISQYNMFCYSCCLIMFSTSAGQFAPKCVWNRSGKKGAKFGSLARPGWSGELMSDPLAFIPPLRPLPSDMRSALPSILQRPESPSPSPSVSLTLYPPFSSQLMSSSEKRPSLNYKI